MPFNGLAQTYIYDFSGLNCTDKQFDSMICGIGKYYEFMDSSCRLMPKHIVPQKGGVVAALEYHGHEKYNKVLKDQGKIVTGMLQLRLPENLDFNKTYIIIVYAANMKGCSFFIPSIDVRRSPLLENEMPYSGYHRHLSTNYGRVNFSKDRARSDGKVYKDFYLYKPQKGDRYLVLHAGGSQRNCRRYIDYVEIRKKE